MNGRVSQYIITSVLAAAIVLPVFFRGPAETPLILDLKTTIQLSLQGLPLLVLLFGISLYGSAEERRSRGWIQPRLKDVPVVFILLAITLLLGMLMPADSNTYQVKLSGITGIALILFLSLITALTEELFFRSWLLSTLSAAGWPRWLLLFVSVAAFAALHLWQGWSGILFTALSGMVYSLWFLRSRRLFPLVIAHTLHNAMALWFAAGR